MSQREVYDGLRQHGSAWLKRHVLYADRQLVVLNKPPGLISQVSNSPRPNETNLKQYLRDIQQWYSSQPFPVHRLDKGTTGCLLVAANQTAARAISQQFRQGMVNKTYLALVQRRTFQQSSGRINNHIKYLDGWAMLREDGKPAITEWRLLASSSTAPLSLVQMNLLTGNKHQLRLHLAMCLNAPILGDSLYSRSTLPVVNRPTYVTEDRMFLHSSEISLFKYLRSGLRFRLEVRAPLPPDFTKICQDFGIMIPSGLEKANISIADTRSPEHPELKELLLWC